MKNDEKDRKKQWKMMNKREKTMKHYEKERKNWKMMNKRETTMKKYEKNDKKDEKWWKR